MKLIVLYGPEDSGKTTTLKMVYERLKKHNLLETNCFKYYDDDARHNDFRDVLVLKKSAAEDVATSSNYPEGRWFDGTNPQDIKDAFPDGDDVSAMTFDDAELNFVAECENPEIFDDEADETDVLKTDVECGEDSDSGNADSNYPLQAPDLSALISKTASLNPKDLFLVGISLEGDYGFQHDKKIKSSWTLHDRNLYKNLKELLFCDTIVCACSVLNVAPTPKYKPVNCVIKFLRNFAASHSIKFRVVESKLHGADGWNKKLKDDKNIANDIVSLV